MTYRTNNDAINGAIENLKEALNAPPPIDYHVKKALDQAIKAAWEQQTSITYKMDARDAFVDAVAKKLNQLLIGIPVRAKAVTSGIYMQWRLQDVG